MEPPAEDIYMDKEEFMRKFYAARSEWDAMLGEVGTERMLEPGVTEDSTVEDSNLAGDDISDDDLDVYVDVEDVYVTEAENAVVDSENVIQDTEFEDDAVIVNDNELEVDLGLGGGAGGFEAEPAA